MTRYRKLKYAKRNFELRGTKMPGKVEKTRIKVLEKKRQWLYLMDDEFYYDPTDPESNVFNPGPPGFPAPKGTNDRLLDPTASQTPAGLDGRGAPVTCVGARTREIPRRRDQSTPGVTSKSTAGKKRAGSAPPSPEKGVGQRSGTPDKEGEASGSAPPDKPTMVYNRFIIFLPTKDPTKKTYNPFLEVMKIWIWCIKFII